MRVLFAGGGTGGHLYPALAVAEALEHLTSDVAIAFIGTPDRLESRLVPQHGYPFTGIEVVGFPRRPGMAWFGFLRKLLAGTRKALSTLREWKPDLVVGTGGYICAPAVLAARLVGVPVALLEQNVVPGLANRALAHLANRVFTSFEPTARVLPPGKAMCLGNPIRTGWRELDRAAARERLGWSPGDRWLVVVGGSLGARVLNERIEDLLDRVLSRDDWHVLHVTGARDHAEVLERTGHRSGSGRYVPVAYHDDLPTVLVAADLVVSRAGATTVAELTAIGRPAVLVPFEFGGKDQPANAETLQRAGAALVVREAHIEDLASTVHGLAGDPEALARMAEASRALGRPDAARDVARALLELTGDRSLNGPIEGGVS
ncbi:MAG: undecaprenyldiphospho-muramoylpentapeptide beta-N-acetylglucosaminyltransferase [bacterium]|nr:undecaprenyldiphospho-muramoylpentapeptide beta-N-acetylglucosaminyltransferase [bacterium]